MLLVSVKIFHFFAGNRLNYSGDAARQDSYK